MIKKHNALKELFTARYNARTDKIEGCSEDSPVYLHELRHRQQFKSSFFAIFEKIQGSIIYLLISPCAILSMLMLTTQQYKIFWLLISLMGLGIMPYALLLFIFEIDATIYQFREARKL